MFQFRFPHRSSVPVPVAVPVYSPDGRYVAFHGEFQQGKYVDQTIREYFPNYDYKGVFFDVGAYQPIKISNSYHFEKNGWDVHCFEANTILIDNLKSLRKNVYNYAICNENKDNIEFNVVYTYGNGQEHSAGISSIELDNNYMNTFGSSITKMLKVSVPQKTLNTIIDDEISYIEKIDIMSIDVEGGELKVLQGLDINKYKPTLMCIENVFNNNNIYNYLKEFDYVLDKQIDYNQYYLLR